MGYRHEADRFGLAGLTPVSCHDVAPPRVAECPVNLEATLEAVHPLAIRACTCRKGSASRDIPTGSIPTDGAR